MNSKLQDILEHIKKRFGRSAEAEEEADSSNDQIKKDIDPSTPEAQKSLVKGDHGTIFGLSRPIVIGGGVLILLIFGLSFFFAADNASTPAPKEQNKQADILDKNASDRMSGDLNDDYGDLARADAEKAKLKNGNNPQNNPNTVKAQPTQAPASNIVTPAPAIQTVPRTTVVSPSYTPPVVPSYGNTYSLPSETPQAASTPVVPTPSVPAASTPASSDDSKSILEEMKKRLTSAIAFATGGDGGSSASDGTTSGSTSSSDSSSSSSDNNGPTYTAPDSNTVLAGTVIPAMLVTGINTDTPGQVYAQTMADVYNLTGDTILIPAGSKILGSYGSDNQNAGQSGRVNVTFDTLVLPDGGSWSIGNSMVAMDGAGYTGIEGQVHRHTGSNFMKGLWNSAMTALSSAAADRVTFDASALTAVTQSQAPTTTVDPGYSFSVYVTQNIAF
mgnify:CR=1 FL=1